MSWTSISSGYGIQPRTLQKIYQSFPRPYPDPQLESHLQIYQQCSILQYRLDRLKHTPLLSDALLQTLNVIRGAPFDIDDCHSLDIEKRFFTATRDRLASQYAQDFLNRGGKWPEVETRYPVFKNGNPILDLSYMHNYAPVLWEMTAREAGHESNSWWFRNGYIYLSLSGCFLCHIIDANLYWFAVEALPASTLGYLRRLEGLSGGQGIHFTTFRQPTRSFTKVNTAGTPIQLFLTQLSSLATPLSLMTVSWEVSCYWQWVSYAGLMRPIRVWSITRFR